MEKLTIFTQFEQKNSHTNLCMCICYFINFRSHLFFSLFSVHNQRTQFSSPHLLFPQMHTNKHTHTHRQTHPHRDTQTHSHTNKPTRTNQQRDRSKLVGLDRCLIRARGSRSVLDRSSWVSTGAWSELVGLDRCLTRARGSWSVLDWSSSWLVLVEWSELVGLLLERSLAKMGLAWSELGRSDWEGELMGTESWWV